MDIMDTESVKECRYFERVKERDKVGVWGFGNVSRDVVLSLVGEGLGKEIVFYGRPKGKYANRAGAWIEDLKANTVRRPRLMGTNNLDDMGGLDVIFLGVGPPGRKARAGVISWPSTRESSGRPPLRSGDSTKDAPVRIYPF